jgi:hypothetical protein
MRSMFGKAAATAMRLRTGSGRSDRSGRMSPSSEPMGITRRERQQGADIVVPEVQRAAVGFTFLRPAAGRWQGRDFQVEVEERSR